MLDTANKVLASGERQPLPARGLLVTTIVPLPPATATTLAPNESTDADSFEFESTDGAGIGPYPNLLAYSHYRGFGVPQCEISGDLEFVTKDVLEAAQRVILAHRDRVRTWRYRHPLSDTSAIRRSQPGAFSSTAGDGRLCLDYVEEAVRDVESLRRILPTHPNGSLGALTEFLDRIYRRVYARRKAAGLPVEPPDNWRDEARAKLWPALTSRPEHPRQNPTVNR